MLAANHVQVMGVLNISLGSFYAKSCVKTQDHLLYQAEQMIVQGAHILDIGAEPTNPSTDLTLPVTVELARQAWAIDLLKRHFDTPISVDTSRPEVMQEAILQGAALINDVRALRVPGAMETVANAKVAICLMHMQYPFGKEAGAKKMCGKGVAPILDFLKARARACCDAGIVKARLILDPGLGGGYFGKNTMDNVDLLRALDRFCALGFPILIGASRKSFLGDLLKKTHTDPKVPVADRLYASLAAAAVAVMKGVRFIRTHDVKETVDLVRVLEALL